MVYQESEKRKAFRDLEQEMVGENWKGVQKIFDQYGVKCFYNEKKSYFKTIKNGILSYLVAHQQMGLVEMLLKNGWDMEKKDEVGFTALYYAIAYGGKEMLQLLIQYGININQRNIEGDSGLMIALVNGMFEEAELLYQNGADINVCNKERKTIFHYLDLFGSEESEKWFSLVSREPERISEKNLKILKAKKLEMLFH